MATNSGPGRHNGRGKTVEVMSKKGRKSHTVRRYLRDRGHAQLSSLPLQILLYLNGWYFVALWICEMLLYIYKGMVLPYPSANLAGEIVMLFMLAAIEYVRLFFGKKGNLTEKLIHVGVSLALALATLFGALYLLLWQTYVLRVELILSAILITFLILETVFSIIAIITFARAESYR